MTKKEFIRSAVNRGYASYAEARDFATGIHSPNTMNRRWTGFTSSQAIGNITNAHTMTWAYITARLLRRICAARCATGRISTATMTTGCTERLR